MSYKTLLNIEVKPIHSEEEREHLVQVCQDKGGVHYNSDDDCCYMPEEEKPGTK